MKPTVRMTAVFIIIIVMALGIALFAAQNPTEVDVRFFTWEAETSITVILVVSVAAGALLAGVVSAFRHLLRGIRHRDALRRIESLEHERDALKECNEELQGRVDMLEESLTQLSQGEPAPGDERREEDVQ